MKRPVLAALSIGLLGLACVSNPVQAQGVPDPCKLYLCMASVSGYSTPAQGCEETIAYWHTPTPDGLAVYYYTFQPQPSYELRLHFMQQCKGSQQVQNNSDIFNTIMREWGHEP
jgi:hypothetical protein